jgi:DNA-binding winged helix-turn-helix (wHTH) protein
VEQDRYTRTYRAAEARQVMGWIEAGQSGCLIGLRGAGKSNFLQFLLREYVGQQYLGRDYADFIFVLIDLLALTECAEWAVYELVLDRLLPQLRPLEIQEETVKEMESLHREVTRSKDPLTAQRAVERCLGLLCRRPAQRIVLLFDEFDAVFRTFDPSLFRCLRAIRDAHKGQVSYVVVVTDDLACLREDLTEVEHFYRLVSRNVCGLGPYNEEDARQMICYLASQISTEFNERDTAHLIALSGRHAGLLKAILSLLWDAHLEGGGSTGLAEVLARIAPALKDEPAVQAECRKVWASLSESEQAALRTLAGGTQTDPHTLLPLKRKGLVREDQPASPLFSPLFVDFIRQQSSPPTKGVIVSRSPRKVQIDRRRVENLTDLEFEMLCHLYENRGRVCTKDELIENVYRQRYDRMTGGVTDEALQTLIARLRAKIEPPRYIVTVRGEGYKFVEPGER